jgi:glyceraldehyde 3-phosphate dehydrogenase
MTTVHCYTGSQPTVDAPAADYPRSRAAALSMVPTTTCGAASGRGAAGPGGRIVAQAVRVPVASVSCVDFHLVTERPSVEEVNAAFRAAGGVIGATDRPLVSTDLRARPESVVMACPETKVSAGGMLRVFGWYDNEWGFSNRMLDMALRMG